MSARTAEMRRSSVRPTTFNCSSAFMSFLHRDAAFAHRILSAKTLRFGYTPHNAEPAEAQFHVDGLDQLIDPAAAKDCGWQK